MLKFEIGWAMSKQAKLMAGMNARTLLNKGNTKQDAMRRIDEAQLPVKLLGQTHKKNKSEMIKVPSAMI